MISVAPHLVRDVFTDSARHLRGFRSACLGARARRGGLPGGTLRLGGELCETLPAISGIEKERLSDSFAESTDTTALTGREMPFRSGGSGSYGEWARRPGAFRSAQSRRRDKVGPSPAWNIAWTRSRLGETGSTAISTSTGCPTWGRSCSSNFTSTGAPPLVALTAATILSGGRRPTLAALAPREPLFAGAAPLPDSPLEPQPLTTSTTARNGPAHPGDSCRHPHGLSASSLLRDCD